MSVSPQEVEHVARLARLALTDEEKDRFTRQLNDVLEYMRKLNELDTSGVEPTTHVLPVSNVMREDAARPPWPLEETLRNSPEEEDGQYRVPPVLD